MVEEGHYRRDLVDIEGVAGRGVRGEYGGVGLHFKRREENMQSPQSGKSLVPQRKENKGQVLTHGEGGEFLRPTERASWA